MNFGYGKPQTNMKYHNAIEKSYYHEKLKNKIDRVFRKNDRIVESGPLGMIRRLQNCVQVA